MYVYSYIYTDIYFICVTYTSWFLDLCQKSQPFRILTTEFFFFSATFAAATMFIKRSPRAEVKRN